VCTKFTLWLAAFGLFEERARRHGACALHPRWKVIADQIEAMLDETAIDRML